MKSAPKGENQGNGKVNEPTESLGKEKIKHIEEDSESSSPMEKRPTKVTHEGPGKMKNKKKRTRGSSRELTK